MKALVTGGAGCIGSDLVEALLARGDVVVAVDNLSSGKIEHIQPFLNNPNFHFIEGDLTDQNFAMGLMDGIDFVYHLAANPDVKFVEGDPTDKDLKQNTVVTYNVLEAMRRAGVKKLAFSSTSAVYGISPIQPIPESSFFPQPISLYGATKLACEGMITAFANLFGIQVWVFRFANIVGPKTRKTGRTVIGDFIARLRENPHELLILGNGKQSKSYLSNQDCVAGILFTIEHAKEPVNIFNLGCADSLEVTAIADIVVGEMGLHDVTYKFSGGEGGWPGDVPKFQLDVTKIKALGWTARHSSRDAVIQATRDALVG